MGISTFNSRRHGDCLERFNTEAIGTALDHHFGRTGLATARLVGIKRTPGAKRIPVVDTVVTFPPADQREIVGADSSSAITAGKHTGPTEPCKFDVDGYHDDHSTALHDCTLYCVHRTGRRATLK
jgi:hypothetical protein